MNFKILALFFTSAILSAAPLADFGKDSSGFFIPGKPKGISTERFTEKGKQYLCIKGTQNSSVYISLACKQAKTLDFAKESIIETNVFLPAKNEVIVLALHIVDARGKLYAFNADLRGMTGARTVRYTITPDAKNADPSTRKNGAIKFPVKFTGFGLLFNKKGVTQNRFCIGTVELIHEPLADFGSATSKFFNPGKPKGITTERITEKGKSYLCIKGTQDSSVYTSLVLHNPKTIDTAKEINVEADIFLPGKNEVIILALHFLDARGKLYVFNLDLQGKTGVQKVHCKFTPDAKNADLSSKKNGVMKFPIKFNGFGLLLNKKGVTQNRFCIGKVDLVPAVKGNKK